MCFVNTHALLGLRNWSLVRPLEFLLRIPPETIVEESLWILDCHARPCRVPVLSLTGRSLDVYLIFGIMWDPRFSIYSWKRDVEASKIIFSDSELFTVPVVELAENRKRFGTGGPLLEGDVTIGL